MIPALAFLYGTLLGSFLNVCIFRLPRGSSIVFPGSACPICKAPVRWWQNIPVIGWLLLGGKCASCGSRISFRYPAVEILCGLLMVLVWRSDAPAIVAAWGSPFFHFYERFDAVAIFARDLIFVSLLVVITLIDWDYQLILDVTTYSGIVIGLAAAALQRRFLVSLAAAAAAALFFYAVRVVGEFVFLREAMGEGDVKLAAMLGAFMGPHGTIIAVILSFPIGIAIALALIVVGMKSRKDYIPFGPAMAIAGFVTMFWGERLLVWYLRFRFGM